MYITYYLRYRTSIPCSTVRALRLTGDACKVLEEIYFLVGTTTHRHKCRSGKTINRIWLTIIFHENTKIIYIMHYINYDYYIVIVETRNWNFCCWLLSRNIWNIYDRYRNFPLGIVFYCCNKQRNGKFLCL